jgi:phage shock protein PspC (stress-responsive transcriptional regulator)
MKKTLTINLNGCVFNIDEDAYQALRQYLEDLGRHFTPEERDEILRDIEARIAELLTEKMANRNVVEMSDVQDVMDTLGQPSQFGDEEESKTATTTEETVPNEVPGARKRYRKLYRDTENKWIGGVCSGLAAYLDWDPTVLRIIFLIVFVLGIGSPLFIYILLWIFMPEAKSVAQQLEMRGVEPNVDNIRNFSAREDISQPRDSGTMGRVLKVLAIVVLSLIGFSLFTAILGVFTAAVMVGFHLIPWVTAGVNEVALLLSVALFLLCPSIAIVMFCIYLVNGKKPKNKWIAWILAILWLISIAGMVITGVRTYNNRQNLRVEHFWEEVAPSVRYTPVVMADEWRDGDTFHAVDAESGVEVRYRQEDTCSVRVKAPEDGIQRLRTEVRNGILYIRNENGRFKDGSVVVEITAPSLDIIKLSDACSFRSGQALNLRKLDLEMDEASSITLAGRIDTLKVKVEEDSHADLEAVTAEVADVRATEESHVAMGMVRDLRVRTTEASNVTYKGRPERLSMSSSDFSVSRWED